MHLNHKIRARFSSWITGIFALLLSGCVGVPQALMPASTNAQDITNLVLTVFEIAAVVFVIVEALLIYTVIHFSHRKLDGLPKQTEGNRRFEIAWTMAPVIVLGIVFVVSLKTLTIVGYQPKIAQSASGTSQTINIRVVGHQWWWEFDYPDQKIITADEMHVPVNATVYLDVESVDVIHSYWVPQLGGKMDAIPGHTNKTWFQPTQIGTFSGQCSEFCGAQHGNMRFTVVVDTPEKYQAWLKDQETAIPTLTAQAPIQGEQAFLNGACIGCHTIDGTKAQGKIGPNLTHFASRSVFAGATLTNTSDNLTKWITDPQAVKPGNLMPNLHLPQDQIRNLVAFLESLK
ncbi:MAG: cytochrome c oxidase subunit II [Anaerolineaceae bacterium]|nr:cytochrome c oxidase subunit II [Anaerolineaceae bacterium]